MIYRNYSDYREVANAIKTMIIRGAPAIGVAAAMGIALGVQRSQAKSLEELRAEFQVMCDTLGRTRPTAVDLFWAIERFRRRFESLASDIQNNGAPNIEKIRSGLIEEALLLHQERCAGDRAIGKFGATLMPESGRVMTQCNAGALATTDNMVGHFLIRGGVGAVVVGADRIAANGDTANKIGTYGIAVLAKENNVPFYVAAPVSTIDLSLPTGDQIPIEERSEYEVTHDGGPSILRSNARALYNRNNYRARCGPVPVRTNAANLRKSPVKR